jgi:hypothetical protein
LLGAQVLLKKLVADLSQGGVRIEREDGDCRKGGSFRDVSFRLRSSDGGAFHALLVMPHRRTGRIASSTRRREAERPADHIRMPARDNVGDRTPVHQRALVLSLL